MKEDSLLYIGFVRSGWESKDIEEGIGRTKGKRKGQDRASLRSNIGWRSGAERMDA